MIDQIGEFATNHWELFLALAVVVALLIRSFVTDVGTKFSVDPSKATELINHSDAVVLDVRPEGEFREGHIINALHIPLSGVKDQLGQLQKYKDKPLIVSCRSGAQSAAACKQLRGDGFDQVYNLKGGMLAWQNANLPVSKRK